VGRKLLGFTSAIEVEAETATNQALAA